MNDAELQGVPGVELNRGRGVPGRRVKWENGIAKSCDRLNH